MAQKKKETTVKKAKTTTKKTTTTRKTTTTTTTSKRGRKSKEIIIQQTLPFYGSDQAIGHQYNKKVAFSPQQHESATDNVVGELVGRLISKIDNEGTKQTQDYSKEIQPINNNNNNYVNVYNDGKVTTTTTDSGSSNSSGSSGSSGDVGTKITDSITDKTIDKTVDYGIGAIGGGIVLGAGAIAGGIYNRKSLGQGIKNLFNGNKLGGTAKSSRLKEELQPIVENSATATKPKAPKLPKGYHEQVPTNPELTPAQPATLFSRRIEEAGGTGMRTPKQALSRSESSSSNYMSRAVQEEFTNTPSQIRRSEPPSTVIKRTDKIKQQLQDIYGDSPIRTRTPPLNSDERNFLQRTLRSQNLDPSNLSPVNTEILRSARTSGVHQQNAVSARNIRARTLEPARPTGIHQHDGVSTRSIRAQTLEPTIQLTGPRVRGRPRTRPYGPQPQPNPRGRPRSSTLSQAQTATPSRTSLNQSNGTIKFKK